MEYSQNENFNNGSLTKFESMLKTNDVLFFDSVEFENIIHHYLEVGKIALAKKAVKLGLDQHPSSVNLKLFQPELCVTGQGFDLLEICELECPKIDQIFSLYEVKNAVVSVVFVLENKRVRPVATIKVVISGPAIQMVIAILTQQKIAVGVPLQLIVPGPAEQHINTITAAQIVTVSIAAHPVVASATIHDIRIATAIHEIVPVSAEQRVVLATTQQDVPSFATIEMV